MTPANCDRQKVDEKLVDLSGEILHAVSTFNEFTYFTIVLPERNWIRLLANLGLVSLSEALELDF